MKIEIDENAITELYAMQNHYASLPSLKKSELSEGDLMVVVDMVNGFCRKGNLSSERCLSVAEPLKAAIERAGLRTVFVCDKHTKDSKELESFPEHCTDNLEINVVDELIDFAEKPENVVYKNSTNAFFSFMKDIEIDKRANCVIIVGVCTDICVLQFALTLKSFFNELNYPVDVAILTDLTETFDGAGHSANLLNLVSCKLLEQNGVKLYRNID